MQTKHWCLSDLLDQSVHICVTDMEMSCDRGEISCDRGECHVTGREVWRCHVTVERGMEMSCDRGERYGDVM